MIYFFFFLMIRRPPRSTLFPTRRSSDLAQHGPVDPQVDAVPSGGRVDPDAVEIGDPHGHRRAVDARSEEHTSELQSPCNLVCRLLLEKKRLKQLSNKPPRTSNSLCVTYP